MKKNLGPLDRLIRAIIGLALLAIGFFEPLSAGWRVFVFILAALQLAQAGAAY